jgi:hypothetical protein
VAWARKEERERESPRVRERRGKKGIGLGQGFGVGLLPFIPFPFFLYSTHSNKHHLNSNKFEFKSDKLNTRKIMLQHECTNNFDPMINFIFLCYKITLNTR